MKIVAIMMLRNEADIVVEGVTEALRWADAVVAYDNSSTDGTPDLAESAGALVMRGPDEPFAEGLRQHTLDMAAELNPDWVWRIDVDEIYHDTPNPRLVFEHAQTSWGAVCIRALQAEFWITLDDVRRGLLLEDERVSVQKRRRWYTIGHTAMVAWRHRPDLRYWDWERQGRKNVPRLADGRDVSELGLCCPTLLLQKHYNCRSMRQLLARMQDRRRDLGTFGKYRHNLVIDESIGLYYHDRTSVLFESRANHDLVYTWYTESERLYREREASWLREEDR